MTKMHMVLLSIMMMVIIKILLIMVMIIMIILLTRIMRASAAMLAPRITKASCVGSTLRERILYSLRLEKVDSLNY